MVVIEFVAQPAEAGLRLGVMLRKRGLSLSCLRGLKALAGGITVNGAAACTNYRLRQGECVALRPAPEQAYSATPQAIPLQVLYLSRDALVVNKPAGMVTHPGPSHHAGTLANAFSGLAFQAGKVMAFRPIGRLDGGTSGLALCAMNELAAPLLARTAAKTYLALASGALPLGKGQVCAPLGPQMGSAVRQQVQSGGRPSQTEYEVLAAAPKASLVLVRPLTGRTHQIRAHFAHLGRPLLGDELYGGRGGALKRHALHCAQLAFTDLWGNRPGLRLPLPADMRCAALAAGLSVGEEYRWIGI